MSKSELKAFLALLKDDLSAPYTEGRIKRIKRRIVEFERKESAEESRRALWKRLAEEDKAMKAEWELLGATFQCNEFYCEWEYGGEVFYRWFSGVRVEDEIHRAREADKKLKEMVL